MNDREKPPSVPFDSEAAINAFLKSQADWKNLASYLTQSSAINVPETVKLAEETRKKFEESRQQINSALDSMRQRSQSLDPALRPQALRIVDANAEWIKAEEKKQRAVDKNSERDAVAAKEAQERLDRELQSFDLMRGLHESSLATATTLSEISKARQLADDQQKAQAGFNKKMAWVALFVALGSLIASVAMPLIDHFAFNAPPPVVVIHDRDLTVPPVFLRSVNR